MNYKQLLAAAALTGFAAGAYAAPVYIAPFGDDGAGTGLQDVLDNATQGGPSSVNVNTDQLDDGLDSYWNITATGGSVSTFVIEIAGNAGSNTFGVYDRLDPTKYVQLFGGADSHTVSSQVTLSMLLDGTVRVNGVNSGIQFGSYDFGFYLGSENNPDNAPLFYSDSNLNGGSDQMVAFQGTNTDTLQLAGFAPGLWTNNEYILAWEDVLYADSDKDFNDLVVMVESVKPVPEPGTLALLGLGLLGLGAARRRKA